MAKKRKAIYSFWTYDLWPDGEGGMSVNNVYSQGNIEITLKQMTANLGTPNEFNYWDTTDLALSRTVGGRGLTWCGEFDFTLFADDRNGNPACELRFERWADEKE